MRKKGRLALLALAVCAAIGSAAVPALAKENEGEIEQISLEPVLEDTAREYAQEGEEKYILKEHNNCISVFYGEDCVLNTDIRTATLREWDRDVLVTGIEVDTYGEVLALLEDFNS